MVISHCLCKQQAICTPLPKHRPLWAPDFRGLRVGRDSKLGSLRRGYSWKLSTACHREMSHAEGEGLMDFSKAAAIYQGGSVHHTRTQRAGGFGSDATENSITPHLLPGIVSRGERLRPPHPANARLEEAKCCSLTYRPPLYMNYTPKSWRGYSSHISTLHAQVAHSSIPGLCALSPGTSLPPRETPRSWKVSCRRVHHCT